jgi:putative transcriptional regulator
MYSKPYNAIMKPQHDIRNNLRKYRLMADGMTQQDLADRVGVTRQTILYIEKGKYSPTIGLALRLARVLGVRVEDLFELERGENDG